MPVSSDTNLLIFFLAFCYQLNLRMCKSFPFLNFLTSFFTYLFHWPFTWLVPFACYQIFHFLLILPLDSFRLSDSVSTSSYEVSLPIVCSSKGVSKPSILCGSLSKREIFFMVYYAILKHTTLFFTDVLFSVIPVRFQLFTVSR